MHPTSTKYHEYSQELQICAQKLLDIDLFLRLDGDDISVIENTAKAVNDLSDTLGFIAQDMRLTTNDNR